VAGGIRLVCVIDSLVPGGAERSLAALAPHYAARGVDLEVAYLHDRPGVQDELERAGAVLHWIGGRGRVDWVRRLTELLTRRQPELVHTTLFESDIAGRIAARRAGVPVVSSLVSELYGPAHFGTPGLQHWKLRGAQFVDAMTARLTVRLHAVSAFVADSMAHRLHYPRDRIDAIPRGRDSRVLGTRTSSRRAAARERLGLAPDIRVLLAVARQEHAKGLDIVLEAMPEVQQRLARVHLLVAGQTGGASPTLCALVDRLHVGDSVTFLGARDDVADLLCAADLFVLPSRREGSPGAVIEAMALELPILVSDIPQMREVVDEDCAVLVAPGSPAHGFASSIESVFCEPAITTRRVHAARERFLDHFTIDHVADEMVAFYGRAIASTSDRSTRGRRR
jgi:glycosyltransferase involved in cell wall biosynthesis